MFENIDSRFKVYIKSKEVGDVVGLLPESLTESMKSDWDAPLNNTPGLVNVGAQIIGGTEVGQNLGIQSGKFSYQVKQIWTGSSPVTLSFDLFFYAVDDEERDVKGPIDKLRKMVAPGAGKRENSLMSTLRPPGPALIGSGGDLISVKMGTFIYYRNVVFNNVDVEWSNKLGSSGIPISAKVSVTLTTNEVITKEDIV